MNASNPPRAPRTGLAAIAVVVTMLMAGNAQAVDINFVDLLPTPPDLTASVDPNIVVTFDDSGSMAWTHMGDDQPYSGTGWSGPWRCANQIDPRVTDPSQPASRAMNGVYYNPNFDYSPPIKSDGSKMPNADATLKKVWVDGIAVNRPVNKVTASTTANFADNPDGVSASNSPNVTDLTGKFTGTATVTAGSVTGSSAVCPVPTATSNITNCVCTGSGSTKKCTWTKTAFVTTSDNRWQCGTGTTSDRSWGTGSPSYGFRVAQNPFDGTSVSDPDTGTKPNGGPVYFRFKTASRPLLTTDPATGRFTAAALTALYTASNWEAVAVPPAQYQNFANWYAYYRYRNVMARTAMSRVFGGLSNNIRVAWQNLGNNNNFNSNNPQLPATEIITNLDDTTSYTQTDGTSTGYRQAFFNWIFGVVANNGTPSRDAAIRAGKFFQRPKTSNLVDPYWEPADGATPGQELACRQNFHLLMTDGLYNQPVSGAPVLLSGNASTASAAADLPGVAKPAVQTPGDPTKYVVGTGAAPTTIYAGVAKDIDGGSTYSDIAFYYWANNLRPDLIGTFPSDKVAPFFPDKKVGVVGSPGAVVNPSRPGNTAEVFWNPVNDPATWPHVVQFAVSLGAFGTLTYSNDIDCDKNDGLGVGVDDLCKLRKGLANSTGAVGWPQPDGRGSGIAANIDDLWHAAINSRGAFFVATDPDSLVTHLTDIINNILQRKAASTAVAPTLPILSAGTDGFLAGYDTSDWSGFLTKNALDPATAAIGAAEWDASCFLTGGACGAARPPAGRKIYTSTGVPGTTKQFLWANLTSFQQGRLNVDPQTLRLDLIPQTWTADAYGAQRVDYLRGDRTFEGAGTPGFRQRSSVLGAVIHGQPLYVSSPTRGYRDIFPATEPEGATARSYGTYQNDNRDRYPMVYVAANDGMLHAFDAITGQEAWAYVPNMLFANFGLDRLTRLGSGLTPTVDDAPITDDVFIKGNGTTASWHTVLLGSMRLGARGIYALDVTVPGAAAGAGAPLWEFTSGPVDGSAVTGDCAAGSRYCSSLGYTYGSINVARLHTGQWVAVVASGYFPKDTLDPASKDPKGKQDSLLVIDMETGKLIREIKTSDNTQHIDVTNSAYGMSTPVVYDFFSDQIDDIAVAGDLAGNLWRFDLSSPTPANWSVDLMFRTYGNSDLGTKVGEQPISAMPQSMVDPPSRSPIFVFGTGKFIGASDRTSNIPIQAYYGIRDFGTGGGNPIQVNELVDKVLTEDAQGVRHIGPSPALPPTNPRGWRIKMNIAAGTGFGGLGELGERSIESAFPFYSSNRVLLKSLIPKSSDLCNPGNRYALMVIDAATGGAVGPQSDSTLAGAAFEAPTPIGDPVIPPGGGGFIIPGLQELPIPQRVKDVLSPPDAANPDGVLGDDIWHRSAWRELLDLL